MVLHCMPLANKMFLAELTEQLYLGVSFFVELRFDNLKGLFFFCFFFFLLSHRVRAAGSLPPSNQSPNLVMMMHKSLSKNKLC